MDPKELRGLMEAYSEVYAPQEIDEAVKGASRHDVEMRKASASERKAGVKNRLSPSAGKANADKMHRDIKFYDKVTKKTKPSVVGMTHEEVEQVDELYKGKHGQTETEYQDSRSNAGKMVSGDSKGSGASYSSRGVQNTGPNPAGGSQKPQGQGRMTSGQRTELQYRKANLLKKEELDIFDVVLEFLQVEGYAETLEEAEWLMANVIDEEAIGIILGEGKKPYPAEKVKKSLMKKSEYIGYEDESDRAARESQRGEKQYQIHKKMTRKEEYVDEAQAARENPEKYEREQSKKSAPVRGERTPMPPRGDKRREDFEKWYAANVR